MPKTITPLTERELCVLAGWFARSNMGQPRAGRAEVQRLLTQKYDVTVNSAVITFCAEFMENEEHEQMFDEEGQGWYKTLKKLKTREKVLASWPDVNAYFWGEPVFFEYAGFIYYVIEERGGFSIEAKEGQHRAAQSEKHKRAALEQYKASRPVQHA